MSTMTTTTATPDPIVRIVLRVPRSLHRELRLLAVDLETSLQKVCVEMLAQGLEAENLEEEERGK